MANSSSTSTTMTYRPVSTSEPTLTTTDNEPKTSITKPKFSVNINVSFSCPLNIPSTLDAAVLRILRNLNFFKPYYVIFIWVVLFITLIPRRQLSLLLLIATMNFGVMYLLLLRAFPASVVLHRWINKWFVLALLALATMIEMILTDAGLHLFFTLVGTIPIILIHAVLQATEEADGADDHNLDATV